MRNVFYIQCLSNKRIAILFKVVWLPLWMLSITACNIPNQQSSITYTPDTPRLALPLDDDQPPAKINIFHRADESNKGSTKTTPDQLVDFAKTLIGIPYLYGSTNPDRGFDCSGLITYVFNHFDLAVPRSSVDFTHMGKEIEEGDSRPGDLILFTGTDSTRRVVGHMGIIVSNENGVIEFIHSTSGKLKGVVITQFKDYYKSRFVKIIRIFPS